jgi:copper chaperone NosL
LKRNILFALVFFLFISCSAPAADKVPPAPSSKAKCPVCGMFVAKYKDWISSITFKDSSTLFFDGPKDMFRFYLNPAKFGSSRKQGEIAALYVKDYYSLAFIDGRRAFYVIGSDVLGPMGKELVPFAKKEDAVGFLKDHGGKRVLGFGEITSAAMKSLE